MSIRWGTSNWDDIVFHHQLMKLLGDNSLPEPMFAVICI